MTDARQHRTRQDKTASYIGANCETVLGLARTGSAPGSGPGPVETLFSVATSCSRVRSKTRVLGWRNCLYLFFLGAVDSCNEYHVTPCVCILWSRQLRCLVFTKFWFWWDSREMVVQIWMGTNSGTSPSRAPSMGTWRRRLQIPVLSVVGRLPGQQQKTTTKTITTIPG